MKELLFSFGFGGAGAWFMSRYAYRFGLLDIPNNRSSHNLPTPRGGGVGILAAYIFTSLWLALPLLIWLPAAFLALVSFFDDKLGLSPRTRLIFQFSAALIVSCLTFGLPAEQLIQHSTSIIQNLIQHPSSTIQHLTMLLFTSIVITGTANFYNFMDGINGIAAITGVVAFVLLGFFAESVAHEPVFSMSSYGIAAACIGFLPLNIPKAKVFMGDVGSILLGFVFAVYLVLLSRNITDFLVVAGFLSTFYIDALTTLYVRKCDGECLSQAHRRHLYQLLTSQLQIPHWKVSSCYGILQLFIGLLLLAMHPFGTSVVAGVIILLVAIWIAVMQKIRRAVEFG